MQYFIDEMRHLVCQPYSIPNLHAMAKDLGIKRCWFHKDHYDAPLRRVEELRERCKLINPRQIVKIIRKGERRQKLLVLEK